MWMRQVRHFSLQIFISLVLIITDTNSGSQTVETEFSQFSSA
jgi:hypothetical protein